MTTPTMLHAKTAVIVGIALVVVMLVGVLRLFAERARPRYQRKVNRRRPLERLK